MVGIMFIVNCCFHWNQSAWPEMVHWYLWMDVWDKLLMCENIFLLWQKVAYLTSKYVSIQKSSWISRAMKWYTQRNKVILPLAHQFCKCSSVRVYSSMADVSKEIELQSKDNFDISYPLHRFTSEGCFVLVCRVDSQYFLSAKQIFHTKLTKLQK